MNIGNRTADINFVHVVGKVSASLEESHTQKDKLFMKTTITVPRLSDAEDRIPVIIDSAMLKGYENVDLKKLFIEVNGRFCSFANYDDKGKSVERYVFVSELNLSENENDLECPVGTNEILLEGEIKYNPIYRRTPNGRIISEFTVACSRKKNQDRVPCVAWGSDAMEIADLGKRTRVQLEGRIQSRDYSKTTNGKETKKTFYEVSVRNHRVVATR